MTWQNLGEDLAEQFQVLEGCALPSHLLGNGEDTGFHTLHRAGKDDALTNAEVLERRRKKWAEPGANREAALDRLRQKKKVRTMTKNIDDWRSKAEMVCVGRELPTQDWHRVLRYPSTPTEIDARTDFIYFLRHCRRVTRPQIGSMLDMSVEEVDESLSTRVVK